MNATWEGKEKLVGACAVRIEKAMCHHLSAIVHHLTAIKFHKELLKKLPAKYWFGNQLHLHFIKNYLRKHCLQNIALEKAARELCSHVPMFMPDFKHINSRNVIYKISNRSR